MRIYRRSAYIHIYILKLIFAGPDDLYERLIVLSSFSKRVHQDCYVRGGQICVGHFPSVCRALI